MELLGETAGNVEIFVSLTNMFSLKTPHSWVRGILIPLDPMYYSLMYYFLIWLFQEDVGPGTVKYRVLQIQECEINNADLALVAGPDIT